MKRNYILVFFCSLVLASCSPEDAATDMVATNKKNKQLSRIGSGPENPANIYDLAGSLYIQIRDKAQSSGKVSNIDEIAKIVGDTAIANTAFSAAYPGYPGLQPQSINWVINNYTPAKVIETTSASMAGRKKLGDMLKMLELAADDDFDDAYDDITAFESTVMASDSLTASDKKIILVTTAVARYEYHNGGKNKYWEHKKPAIFGSINGAEISVAQAVTMAAAMDIAL